MNNSLEESNAPQPLERPSVSVQAPARLILGQFLFIEFLSLLLLLVSAAGGYVVLAGDFSDELKGAVVMAGLVGGFIGVREYWLGTSSGSARKTELMAEQKDDS